MSWHRIGMSLATMRQSDLHKVKKLVHRELHARWLAREACKEGRSGGFAAMANLMAGVTWALACRSALRESKGHHPLGGVRPQSGEMWLPRELLTAVRHQVKARGWHPLTAPDWLNVQHNLRAEVARAGRPPEAAFAAMQFHVRMAKPVSVARVLEEDPYMVAGGEA